LAASFGSPVLSAIYEIRRRVDFYGRLESSDPCASIRSHARRLRQQQVHMVEQMTELNAEKYRELHCQYAERMFALHMVKREGTRS
jgi:hypothetical protein